MSKEFLKRQKFIESCNQLVLALDGQELNENIFTDFSNQLFDNIKNTKEITFFYKKLLTNNKALQYYLTQIKDSVVRNINQINNDYLDKLLNTLNNTPSLKNLLYLSVLACATSFYINNYTKIPDLVKWFVGILDSQLLDNITLDSIFQFFEMLIKIVGTIAFIYKVLIEPYKNQILKNIIGNINLNKQNTMTESRFTNYNKTNMKKVRITESQLRGMVKKMIRENVETKYAELAKKGFNPQEIQNIKNNFSAVQILNKMDLNRDVINSDKQTIHTMLLQPDKVQMGTTTISESQLRGMIRKMLMEQTAMGGKPIGTPQSSLSTAALKQTTTDQTKRNTQQKRTLTQVDTPSEFNGQFITLMQGVDQKKYGPQIMPKQRLLTSLNILLGQIGYK